MGHSGDGTFGVVEESFRERRRDCEGSATFASCSFMNIAVPSSVPLGPGRPTSVVWILRVSLSSF